MRQETLRFHSIAIGLPRVAVKDDVIPLTCPILLSTGETISEIPVKAGQVVYASFVGYQQYLLMPAMKLGRGRGTDV